MWLLLVLSALGGFSVLLVELAAPRLVAPTLGATHLTWSVVFAVFLGALAVGNAVGGRWADGGGRRTLVWQFLCAALCTALVAPLSAWLRTGPLAGVEHGVRTLLVVGALFAPARVRLGAGRTHARALGPGHPMGTRAGAGRGRRCGRAGQCGRCRRDRMGTVRALLVAHHRMDRNRRVGRLCRVVLGDDEPRCARAHRRLAHNPAALDAVGDAGRGRRPHVGSDRRGGWPPVVWGHRFTHGQR